MKLFALILTPTFLLWGTFGASATVYRMITGDYTTINADWSAYENGWSFDTVENGSPSQPLISTQHYAGNYSVQIQVPTDNSGNKERFEYVICHASDTNGVHFDNARYCGFTFKLASPAAAFLGSDLFWQAWQGSPWGPPASLKLTTSSGPPFTVGLYIRNMTTGPDSSISDVKLWSSAIIQTDTWYNVVIYISPRFTNNIGNIKLWINGTNFVNAVTNIGYDPSQTYSLNGTSYGVLNGLDIKDGIYQPDANNGHTIFFDQIIFADTYAEAAALPLPQNSPPSASPGSATILRNTSANMDLAALTSDPQIPSTQCLYSVSATNGTAVLLANAHTARLSPATNFLGTASYTYTVTDNGEDSREFLHYSFAPPDYGTNGFVTDNSGHLRDGNLLAVGNGAFAYSSNSPWPLYNPASLQLMKIGTTNAARLSRYISDPAELNLSDSSWTFAGWFQRIATTNHDFVFYIGTGDGFGGDGDELQFYCPSGSTTIALNHYNAGNTLDASLTSAATAAAGQWHHAALVFQRTNSNTGILSAYLDGTQFGATNVSWALQQQMPVVFGGHNKTNSNVNRWFNGWLADLVIFTNALSPSEISNLATRTVAQFGGLSATNRITVTVTNYARPLLNNLAWTNGVWAMTVNGDVGATYSIQISSNLTDWSSLFTTNPPSVPFYFSDNSPNSLSQRFYRGVVGP